MTDLILSPAQQTTLNAAGKVIAGLGLRISLSHEPGRDYPNVRFVATARAEETNYQSGCAETLAAAVNKCLVLVNADVAAARAIAEAVNGPKKLRLPSEVVAAVKEQAEALADPGGDVALGALLETLDALPVKD